MLHGRDGAPHPWRDGSPSWLLLDRARRAPHARDVNDRWALLRSRSFRWNDGAATDGYLGAEVSAGTVTWFAWSHTHGEGRRDLGTQSLAELEQVGPPLRVPERIIAQVTAALLTAADAAERPR